MDVVVGLDCGTTSTKAVAAGADGVVRAVARAGYRLAVPAPGRAELDPGQVRAAAVAALTDLAGQLTTQGHTPAAVCVGSAMHGLVPLEQDGTPRGPLLTWADGRAAEQVRRLHAEGRAEGLSARTGTPVHPMSPLAKLVHAREEGLEAPWWGGVKELLLTLLCPGSRVLDLSSASSSGMWDARSGGWDAEALDLTGLDAGRLGEVVPTTHVVGRLAPGLGLPEGLPVVAGATDGPLANLGTGAVGPGVVAVSLGTSGALRVVQDGPGAPAGLFSYALTQDRWVVGGAVNNAGSAVRWAGDLLGEDDLDALLGEAARVPVLSDGLLCLPYLLGERAPWWRPGLSGSVVGLRRDHGRGHLVRAVVEGVCQQLALVRDGLPGDAVEVRATGGGTTSALWLDVLGAALDLPVRVAASPEGSGLGACLLGWHALGALPDLDAAAALVEVDAPRPPERDAAARYRRARPLVERAALLLADLDLGLLADPSRPRLDP